jgi:putative ABC transport system permease protein
MTMFKLSLRDLMAHIGRYVLTFLAVAIGVTFIGGVLTLTDTITTTFDDLFADANAGTDAWVRASDEIEVAAGPDSVSQRARIDDSLTEQILEVDGVAEAEGYVQGYTRPIDQDGDPYGNPEMGAPTFGASWSEVDELNPFELVDGSEAPQGPGEIVLDKGTADGIGYEVGDTARFQTPQGQGEAEVVGIATFGSADSPFGASFVLFDLTTAEELLTEPGRVNGIGAVAEEGVSQTQLRDRITDALEDDQLEVLTGEQLTQEDQDDAQSQFGFFRTFLLVFAFISVFVGGFVIYTSFSFIVAQRQRQVALLRAVGASRRQVLGSILIESFVVGLLASIAGFLVGVTLAGGLSQVIAQEAASLVILPASVITALAIGTAATMLSAFYPAWRGARTPPVAAMLEAAVDTSHRSLSRLITGLLAFAAGVAFLVIGVTGAGIQVTGLGMLLVFVAFVILGPIAVRPAVAVLGWPLPRIRGIVGRLSTQNAARNPRRTSATASALMIGMGIVTLVLVMNASLRASIDQLVDDRFRGDFVVESGTGFSGGGLPSDVAQEINELPEVEAAAGVRIGIAEIDGSTQVVGGVDPSTAFDVFDVGVADGNADDLDADGIAVFEDKAEDEGWRIGDELDATFAETGRQTFTIVALLETQDLTGTYVMGTEAIEANVPNSGDNQILVQLADGASTSQARSALQDIVDQYPTAELQDLDEFKEATKGQFDQLLIIVNALLALTLIVAMIGIVNTLVLSVVERTREIGLTRAVGAARKQIRATIRWEALLIAAFGLVAALTVGTFFGWVIFQALDEEGFTSFEIPVGQLVVVTIVTALLTLLAAVFPAIWAGRRPVLSAISEQ